MNIKFSRGYSDVKDKVVKSFRYTRSCENCKYYFMSEGDEEELCQNPNVLPYDICVEENRTYCSFWRYVSEK